MISPKDFVLQCSPVNECIAMRIADVPQSRMRERSGLENRFHTRYIACAPKGV
jgi:hypothetical protein